MGKNLIVFDMDGTLYKTDTVSIPATQKALEELGLPVLNADILRSFFGDPSDVFCSKIAPGAPEDVIKKLEERIGFYELLYIPAMGELYDGIVEMLKVLEQKGFTLAICSHAGREYIDCILKAFKLEYYFTHIKTYRPGTSKAELLSELLKDVEPAAAVMVGDRFYDFEAAQANGIASIGVLYGYSRQEALSSDFPAENAEAVVEHTIRYFGL